MTRSKLLLRGFAVKGDLEMEWYQVGEGGVKGDFFFCLFSFKNWEIARLCSDGNDPPERKINDDIGKRG